MTVIVSHYNRIYTDSSAVQFGMRYGLERENFAEKMFEDKSLYNEDRSLVCMKSGLCLDEQGNALLMYLMQKCYASASLQAAVYKLSNVVNAEEGIAQDHPADQSLEGVSFSHAFVKVPLRYKALEFALDALYASMTKHQQQIVIAGKAGAISVSFKTREAGNKAKAPSTSWIFEMENLTGQPNSIFGSGGALVRDLIKAGYTVAQAVQLSTKYHMYGHDFGITVIDTNELASFNPRSSRLPRLKEKGGSPLR